MGDKLRRQRLLLPTRLPTVQTFLGNSVVPNWSAGQLHGTAYEKTKTQGQNSCKKLKKRTQPLGGLSLPHFVIGKNEF